MVSSTERLRVFHVRGYGTAADGKLCNAKRWLFFLFPDGSSADARGACYVTNSHVGFGGGTADGGSDDSSRTEYRGVDGTGESWQILRRGGAGEGGTSPGTFRNLGGT